MKKNKSSVFVLAILVALPLATHSVFALAEENVGSQSKSQALGYIGKLSESVISSGVYDRLVATDYSEHYVNGETLSARIKFWHHVALDATALDHTPKDEKLPIQGGPTRTSRALAMVQIAVFEVLNTLDNKFNAYTPAIDELDRLSNTSLNRDVVAAHAVVSAAYETLVHLYPNQRERLSTIRSEERSRIGVHFGGAVQNGWIDGILLGLGATAQVIIGREEDRSEMVEPDFGEGGAIADGGTTFFGAAINNGSKNIGEWEPDPNTPRKSEDFDLALGAYWGNVEPFFLRDGDQFRAPVPPLVGSAEYANAFKDVAAIGGAPDNGNTISTSTGDTRIVGNYWGYDGVPLVGVPPRIYNQIAVEVASNSKEIDAPVDLARFLAMVNVAMADSAIAAWDSKYFYNYWRPVTGVRRDDGDDNTATDPDWNPVGASVINTQHKVRVSPPFPAYPSGHAAFGAATFEVMRRIFGDDTHFTFVSDEFNGEGFDPFTPDTPRPLMPVRFDTLTAAQEQNGISRIYNGVHWRFDDTAGQEMGLSVARYLLDSISAFQPK